MRIAPSATTTFADPVPAAAGSWTNPAASAALRSTADLLKDVEDGIVRNFKNAGLVASYAADLRSTSEIIDAATTAISTDDSKENDAFLQLLENAGGSVSHAQDRLSSADLVSTWPLERGDILAAVRRAKAISSNVADQLDPRSTRVVG
ncbi:MAG: hypothetical protein JWM98_1626 [Thermoleophilia bacterium]|nr:hypothetical protein [Thermoleophilia bacterium]